MKRKRTGLRKTVRKAVKRRSAPLALIITGIILMGIWGAYRLSYFRSLSISQSILSAYGQSADTAGIPYYIRVGSTIRLSVIEAGFINGTWTISPDKANHVRQSARPGTGGNIIIYAHNKQDMFGALPLTKPGDSISILTNTGQVFGYTVERIAEVDPGDTALLKPTTSEVLTIYTCSGFFDSKRFVVRAVPVSLQQPL